MRELLNDETILDHKGKKTQDLSEWSLSLVLSDKFQRVLGVVYLPGPIISA